MFKPGDLVMLVKPAPCCGDESDMGVIVTVVGSDANLSECSECGSYKRELMVDFDDGTCAEPSRLRLIPPLSELETTEREVEHAA